MNSNNMNNATASNNLTSNPGSDEIDSETAAKLRGDAIGDTMYSEVFVIKSLLQFSDLQWNKDVEDDLCSLWDMTSEPAVCKYLLDSGFPALAQSAIEKYDEPRFVEIVIGIFANLMCSEHAKEVTEESLREVLHVIDSDDPLILIQVMRFIHAVSYKCNKLEFVTREIVDKFVFILSNSINKELVLHTLKTLGSITTDCKISENVVGGEILKGALSGFKMMKGEECDFLSQDMLISTKYLIEITCNLCSYVDTFNAYRLANELNVYLGDFLKEMSELMSCFSIKENLEPISEELVFYVKGLTYISRLLNVGYIQDLFKSLCKILFNLNAETVDLEVFIELFCYNLSRADVAAVKNDLLCFDNMKIRTLLLDVQKMGLKFEFEYCDKLNQLLSE